MVSISARTYWNIHEKTGWNQCNLEVDGKRVSSCNGGGYDMQGTCFGSWIARTFVKELRERIKRPFDGLTFHDPDFDVGKVVVPGTGETIEALDKAGKSLGLDRYQAFLGASSPIATERHTVAMMDGACGIECMFRIFEAIGGKIEYVRAGHREVTHYQITLPNCT